MATVVERIPEMAADEPTVIRHDDELVLQFGEVPERGRAPIRDQEAQAVTQDRRNAPQQGRRRNRPINVASDSVWYVIQPGDTLSSIALEKLGSAALAEGLARLNNLADPDDLHPGDRIQLR